MPSPYSFVDPRLGKLDGFQVEIDEAHVLQPERHLEAINGLLLVGDNCSVSSIDRG